VRLSCKKHICVRVFASPSEDFQVIRSPARVIDRAGHKFPQYLITSTTLLDIARRLVGTLSSLSNSSEFVFVEAVIRRRRSSCVPKSGAFLRHQRIQSNVYLSNRSITQYQERKRDLSSAVIGMEPRVSRDRRNRLRCKPMIEPRRSSGGDQRSPDEIGEARESRAHRNDAMTWA